MLRAALVFVPLGLGACWNGEEAQGKPCRSDAQCGQEQQCTDDRFCGSRPSCMPRPTTCDPTRRVIVRDVVAGQVGSPGIALTGAAVPGELAGDAGAIDLVVLEAYAVHVLENAGGESWPSVYLDLSGSVTAPGSDLAVANVDGDDALELVVLGSDGTLVVFEWDGTPDSPRATITLDAGAELFAFEVADVVGSAAPEVVVAGTFGVQLVSNPLATGGLVPLDASLEPRDVLVIGSGADARIVAPSSAITSFAGERNQVVNVYRPDGALATALASDFENPWVLAQGDFLGDTELEIVVAERRLNVDGGGTTQPGRLRFFRMDGDAATEVGEPLDIGVGPVALAAADLDCDGKTDLAIGYSGEPAGNDLGQGAPAQLLFGSCEESASADELVDVPQVGDQPLPAGDRIGVGDFDDDGLLEVAIPIAREPSGGDGGVVVVGVEERR